jgi:hypothetical protein
VLRPVFASWLGWLVELDRPLVFVLDDDQDRADLVRQCLTIGHEHLLGELDGDSTAWADAGLTDTAPPPGPPRLGIRANLAQFSLLVGINALVGGMIGQERTVLPMLAERVFHLEAFTAALTFIVAFGAVKAATNFFAGTLSDRYGRKPILVAGWLIGLPVPLLLLYG